MREFIVQNLTNTESLNIGLIVLNNVVTLVMAFFIMFVYRITYSGPAYSRKYNISIGMITIITTMIMSVISNNIALSLGMVGALSIIRFRTAVKEVRDAAFVFWGIAVGIGCGVSQYTLVGIGSLTLFVFMLLTRQIRSDDRQLLVVTAELGVQNKVQGEVETYFGKAAHLTMKNGTRTGCEFVYTITQAAIEKANKKNQSDIVEKLLGMTGVHSVNLVEQLDDISK